MNSFSKYLPFVGDDESAIGFLAIPLVFLGLFLVIPMLLILVYSFLNVQSYQVVVKLTLGNYVTLLTDSTFITYFINTVKIALITTVCTVVIGYPLAYYMAYEAERPELWIISVLGPFFTVYLIRAYSWFSVLGRGGLINRMLIGLGLIQNPIDWLIFGPFAVVTALVHGYLPYVVLTIFATLEGLDKTELEAARDLGATPLRAFYTITLPQSLPGVVIGALFVFIPSFGAFVTPELLGGGLTPMLAPLLETYMNFSIDISKTAAGSVIMMTVVVGLTGILFRLVQLQDLFAGGEKAN